MQSLTLLVLDGTYAICRLEKGSTMPDWAFTGEFYSIMRTQDELSVVCLQKAVPEGVRFNGGWKSLKAEGPLDFSMTGVLASLAVPLANAGVSIFALSTYDTDYILVKEYDLEKAIEALNGAGYNFI